MQNATRTNFILTAITVVCMIVATVMLFNHKPTGPGPTGVIRPASLVEAIKTRGVIRVGWGGYPPYVSDDPVTHQKTGFSVDLINEITAAWNHDIKVEWVETTWDRMLTDMSSGRFDLMVEPMFETIPRASEVNFSKPYCYFGYAAAIVLKDDTKFNKIEDLNDPSVTVAVGQGVADHEYARQNLPRAKLNVIAEGGIEAALTEVLFRRADVGLGDLPTVTRFAREHSDRVKALFTKNPPGLAPVGFMFPKGDYPFARFLDVALEQMESSGELHRLAMKHKVPYIVQDKHVEYPQ